MSKLDIGDMSVVLCVKEMLFNYLQQQGQDGLFNDMTGCSCTLSDLCRCGKPQSIDCRGGWSVKKLVAIATGQKL